MSWIAHAVTLVIGFLLMPYILHTVGDSTYGTWLLINSVAGQTGLLYLGFGDAISRYTSKYVAEKRWIELNRTFSCITSVYLGSATLAFSIGCLLAYLAPIISSWPGQSLVEVQTVIFLLGLNAAISIAGSAFGGVLMGIQRFDVERSIIITISLLRLGLTLYFLQARNGLITLALIFLTITIIENLLTCLFAFRLVPHLQLRWRYLRRRVYRRCFGFSFFSFLSLVSEHLVYLVDTIVIGFILGPIAVVPYYIASRLCEMIRSPLIQIGHVFLPRAGQLQALKQIEHLKKLVLQGIGVSLLLSASTLIGAIYFGDLMIQVWIGSGYTDSHWILMILLAGQVIALPTHLLRHVLTGTGLVRVPALLFLCEACSNLVLSLVLMQFWGLYGVAFGTLIPILIIEVGFLLPYGMRHLKLSVSDLFFDAFVPQSVPLSLIVIYSLLVSQLNLLPSWYSVIGIAAGAGTVLSCGIGLAIWDRKHKSRRLAVDNQIVQGANG